MESKLPIGFTLDGIKTEQFAVIESAFKQECTVDISASVTFSIDREHKRVRVIFGVQFLCQESPFVLIEVGCYFSIKPEDFNSLVEQEHNRIFLPTGLARHLATLSVGTVRGILHAKLEDTKFKDFILPTINVNELVKEGIEFKT